MSKGGGGGLIGAIESTVRLRWHSTTVSVSPSRKSHGAPCADSIGRAQHTWRPSIHGQSLSHHRVEHGELCPADGIMSVRRALEHAGCRAVRDPAGGRAVGIFHHCLPSVSLRDRDESRGGRGTKHDRSSGAVAGHAPTVVQALLLSPMMPSMMQKREASLMSDTVSAKMTMPNTAVPAAPMPVQTA